MTVRRILAVAACVAALVSVPTTATATPARALPTSDGGAIDGCSQDSDDVDDEIGRKPVVYVHGFNDSAPQRAEAAGALQDALGRGEFVVLKFDYGKDSNSWADETAISTCLASYLARVSTAYKAGGGDGRVATIGHSMGGLAIRFASAQRAGLENDARVGSILAGVVTVATPHQGSPWGGTAIADVVGLATSFAGGRTIALPAGTDAAKCLAPPQRRDADCGVAPYLIGGVPLVQLGTDITIERTLFKTRFTEGTSLPIPLVGDGIVPVSSAHGYVGSGPAGETTPKASISLADFDCTVTSDYLLAQAGQAVGGRIGGPVGAAIGALAGTAAGLVADYIAQGEILSGDERADLALAQLTAVALGDECFHTNLMGKAEIVESSTEAIRGFFDKPSTAVPQAPLPDLAGTGEEPVLIVLDLSDSMNETDERGDVKLGSAKFGIRDVIREQEADANFGLYTYPGLTDDCSPGRVESDVADFDIPALTAKVSALTTRSGTPTGPALSAATEHLRQQGFRAGKLLLVSDGESNCGGNPCQVATDLADQGFEVTMDAMGIDISEEGRRELQCITAATGGTYYDVQESALLGQTLAELTRPALDLRVTFQDKVPPRGRTRVLAELTNTSNLAASDVILGLSFAEGTLANDVPPQVLRARQRVGNLPPGQSVTREWAFSPGTASGNQVTFRVLAQADGTAAVLQEGTVSVTDAFTLADAGPLLRQVDEAGGTVAIMGDSYSAGEGAGDYDPDTDTAANRCHRSPHTYAMTLFDPTPTVLACSGAVVRDFTEPQDQKGETAQLGQLNAMSPAPDLVLLTVGGNDVDFGGLVKACVLPGDCSNTVVGGADVSRTRLMQAGAFGLDLARASRDGGVGGLYRQIHDTVNSTVAKSSRGGRTANIVVLPYPQATPETTSRACPGLSAKEVTYVGEFTRLLNTSISDAVDLAAARGVPVYFAEDVQRAVLPDHTACDPEPWINPVDLAGAIAGGAADYQLRTSINQQKAHPNKQGYDAMTTALVQWSRGVAVRTDGIVPAGNLPDLKPGEAERTVDLGEVATSVGLKLGEAVLLRGTGFGPGEAVRFMINSRPRTLASVWADENGVAEAVVSVPSDLAIGAHTVQAFGLSPGGEVRIVDRPVTVSSPRPAWQMPVLGASAGAALLGAVVLGFGGMRGRRRERP